MLERYKKAIVAFVIAAIALAGFFITFDPGFQTAAIAVIIAGFNVASVLLAKNHSVDDVAKAVQALQASSLAMVALFITVDPSTVETIGAAVLALLNVYGVWYATNKPVAKRG